MSKSPISSQLRNHEGMKKNREKSADGDTIDKCGASKSAVNKEITDEKSQKSADLGSSVTCWRL